jgi:hypothetical protein
MSQFYVWAYQEGDYRNQCCYTAVNTKNSKQNKINIKINIILTFVCYVSATCFDTAGLSTDSFQETTQIIEL